MEMHDTTNETATVKEQLFTVIGDFKKLKEESILIANLGRKVDTKEAMQKLATLLRDTPILLRSLYFVQKKFDIDTGINFDNFIGLETLGEEISESIRLGDWILLSDILEFEYTALIDEWIISLETFYGELQIC